MERRLAAILAADVVGYSRLMEQDEAGTLAALKARLRDVVDPLVAKHRGRIFKTTGDGVLVEYNSAVNAVQCAVDLQQGMAAANSEQPEDRHIVLRIGVNLGDVMVEGSDLYGDGVNVAARLEGLAEPGNIFVSSSVFDQVKRKLASGFDELGQHAFKNIAEPVRVYRVQAGSPSPTSPKAAVKPEPAVPEEPSIAVLPFANLSGDPAQDYLCDGVTEGLISGLGRYHDLFVIDRVSSFTYKGKIVHPTEVSRNLGVRFLLTGSVRITGRRIRVCVELVEGQAGHLVWTNRYDRDTNDVFAVQDEVTEIIVGTLMAGYGGRLRRAWTARRQPKGIERLEAMDYFHRALDGWTFTKEGMVAARGLLTKAIERDPGFAKAYGKLAWSHMVDSSYGLSDDYKGSMEKAREWAVKAVAVDDGDSWAHWALGSHHMLSQRHDLALEELQKALDCNPNDAEVITDYGLCHSYAGRAEDGIAIALKAMRLNPHHQDWYTSQLGQLYFDARRYDKAIATFASLRWLDSAIMRVYQAASFAMLDRNADAAASVRRALELDPKASIEKWGDVRLAPYAKEVDLQHFRTALRKAGLPE